MKNFVRVKASKHSSVNVSAKIVLIPLLPPLANGLHWAAIA